MGRTVGPCPSRRKDSDHRDVFTRVQSDGGLPTRPDRGSRGRAEWGAPHAIGMLPRQPPPQFQGTGDPWVCWLPEDPRVWPGVVLHQLQEHQHHVPTQIVAPLRCCGGITNQGSAAMA